MLTANEVLAGYQVGIFAMADPDEDNQIYWYKPKYRGVILMDEFHISKNLSKLYKNNKYIYTINAVFGKVIDACADREETWISDEIKETYTHLHQLGYAHSIEVWQNNLLVGGLYGVALGKIFFGESMFHKATNASKLAMVHLYYWLKSQQFYLIDCQFITEHLKQFGAKEIPQKKFELILNHQL